MLAALIGGAPGFPGSEQRRPPVVPLDVGGLLKRNLDRLRPSVKERDALRASTSCYPIQRPLGAGTSSQNRCVWRDSTFVMLPSVLIVMPPGVANVYFTLMNPLTTPDAPTAELLTVFEVAMMCHCSAPRIRRRIADGSVLAVKLGEARSCAIRIPGSALDEWLHREATL
jgi:hypothetical protein